MGALGHYLEEEGVATTQISLVREHTELIQPPRALWVPFMLGRPFGAPNAPDFQHKVLAAALRLLEAESGPVLRDFPEDAPRANEPFDMEGFACPVNLRRAQPDRDGRMDVTQALLDEVAQLLPWHDLAVKRRGRSAVGISGIAIEEAARYVASHLAGAAAPSYDKESSAAEALKRACDDLHAYYCEAVAAQPGNSAGDEIQIWFWRQTAAGRLFLDLQGMCRASPDKSMQLLGRSLLVPRAVTEGAS
ncbi:MAG: hypothetical protein HY017_26885 [Betaproteobacteria bacterium]|nr:hypothetical protein [Betaproteobacteria bacterium]